MISGGPVTAAARELDFEGPAARKVEKPRSSPSEVFGQPPWGRPGGSPRASDGGGFLKHKSITARWENKRRAYIILAFCIISGDPVYVFYRFEI